MTKSKSVKLSIITVVYNNPAVKDAIESVLSQTYKNIEYIIIDGGSTDGTLETVKRYGNKINVFISEPDQGIYDAMNKGLKLATGDIIGFLNSDDFYADREVLTEVIKEFSKGYDCVYGDLKYISSSSTDASKVIRYWKSQSFRLGLFRTGWHPAHPTFFLRRAVYLKYGGFDLSFKIAADYEIMLRLLERYRIGSSYIPKTMVVMRMGGKSNRSLKNIIIANLESYRAWKKNQLSISPGIIFYKPLSKIFQFFKKEEP